MCATVLNSRQIGIGRGDEVGSSTYPTIKDDTMFQEGLRLFRQRHWPKREDAPDAKHHPSFSEAVRECILSSRTAIDVQVGSG